MEKLPLNRMGDCLTDFNSKTTLIRRNKPQSPLARACGLLVEKLNKILDAYDSIVTDVSLLNRMEPNSKRYLLSARACRSIIEFNRAE